MNKNRIGLTLTQIRVRKRQTRLEQAQDLKVHPKTLARWVAGTHLPDPTSPTGAGLEDYLRSNTRKGR